MSKGVEATLFSVAVLLTQNGEIAVDVQGPPNPKQLEEAFNNWNEDYEHTKKIASLAKYLQGYSNRFVDDLTAFIS